MSLANASRLLSAASLNAAVAVATGAGVVALRGDDPVTRIARDVLESLRDRATAEALASFGESLAEAITPATPPWESSDAAARTRTEEWQREVRSRQASASFAERLPLP